MNITPFRIKLIALVGRAMGHVESISFKEVALAANRSNGLVVKTINDLCGAGLMSRTATMVKLTTKGVDVWVAMGTHLEEAKAKPLPVTRSVTSILRGRS